MDNKEVLKNILEAKRKNPYTENKTIDEYSLSGFTLAKKFLDKSCK